MMKIPINIRDGKIVESNAFLTFLEVNEGKECEISVKKKTRSLSQNAYYWVYLTAIAEETGNLEDDLHEFFKRKLLPPKFITIKGKVKEHEMEIPKSTTELSKGEMTEYLDKICAMSGVALPNPESVGYITN